MVLSLAVAALVALAGLPSAQAITPNCFFNVSITDNSPLFQYDPRDSWFSRFVNSPAGSWKPGSMGAGASAHLAFGPGPKATIEYPGSIAWARGGLDNVSSTPLDFQIDGVKQPQPQITENITFLATSAQDVSVGLHTASFALDASSTHPRALIILQIFQHLCGVVADTDDPDKVMCTETEFAKEMVGGRTNFILHGNGWTPYQTFGGSNGQPTIDYSSIFANNTPSVSLYPPKGANYFYLNGTVGNAYGLYDVKIDPAPPYPRQMNTFNSSNSWEVPGETLFYTPLDPEVEYEITVTGDKDVTKYLGLHSWMYCKYNSSGPIDQNGTATGLDVGPTSLVPVPIPSKKSNVGAIAGGVVGGVVGAALIAGLLFWFCRRNRNKHQGQEADPAMFTVDDTVDATTPYHPPGGGGVAKLAQDQAPYGSYAGPTYGQQLYQEPNMAEVGYTNGTNQPLLSPFGTSDASHTPSRQGSGPFGDRRQSSVQWGGGSDASGPSLHQHNGSFSDPRQSFSAASAGMQAGAAGYASGYGSGYTSEKSIPAHQQRGLSRVEHEQDAGGLPMPAGTEAEDVEKLPPTYNPHWLEARTSDAGVGSSSSAGPGASSSSMPPGAAPAAFADYKGQVPVAGAQVSGERALPSIPQPEPTHPQGGAPFQPPQEKQ